MTSFLEDFRAEIVAKLEELETAKLRRRLTRPRGIDFSSNDYLGLSGDGRLVERLLCALDVDRRQEIAISAPASRLLCGNTSVHEHLEERLARFKGAEAALLFSSGYQANLGVLTALVGPNDRVLSDEQNHASIIDAVRLCRARKSIYPHLDRDALTAALSSPHPGGRTFVVTESLFSMDGDIAPLADYAELAERHGAGLIVDDAHATGVFGKGRGSGLVEHFGVEGRVVATISTLGKAIGLHGAFAAGSPEVIDYLVNRSRPFVFSTAQPTFLLRAIEIALDLIEEEPARRGRVLALADRLRRRLASRGIDCLRSGGPIVPVLVGDNQCALDIAGEVCRRGFDVRAIRPPSVARGTARLRIAVHADHTEAEVDGLGGAVVDAFLEAAVSSR